LVSKSIPVQLSVQLCTNQVGKNWGCWRPLREDVVECGRLCYRRSDLWGNIVGLLRQQAVHSTIIDCSEKILKVDIQHVPLPNMHLAVSSYVPSFHKSGYARLEPNKP